MAKHDKKDMLKRHVKLHRNLDELIACFFTETELLASTTTLMEFLQWSHKMTENPTCAETKLQGRKQ